MDFYDLTDEQLNELWDLLQNPSIDYDEGQVQDMLESIQDEQDRRAGL